jgi:hypothetical protein
MIDEAVKPASKNDKGPFAIATKTRAGSLRRVPDTRFDTYDSAHKYGMQYHTDRYGSQMFHVVHHPDAKKKIHEDAPANMAGPATSTSDVHWSQRQPRIGPKGKLRKYGQPMIFKAVVRRKPVTEQLHNPPMKKVYYKILKKKVPAVSRTSSMGGGSDGSGGNGGEQVQRESIVKADGGFRLVSKKSGKNLGTYSTRAGAERRERQVQFFKHKG